MVELRRDPKLLAMTPVIPTKLTEPVETTVGISAPGNIAWGVREVGAAASLYDGSGVKVAVLDTGIDAAHAAFAGVRLDQNDFTNTGVGDGHGHGTHCAGTIFGRDVGGLRIGVARGVGEAMIGKVLDAGGRGNSSMLFKAMSWAINGGANVISMSLGFDFPGYAQMLHQQQGMPVNMATSVALRAYTANLRAFDALMQFARAQAPFTGGSIVLAATGNESQHAMYPISASMPAAADGVIAVGAVGSVPNGFQIATFSNTDCLLVAPGVDIESARIGGGTVAYSGTSMACPHAAGVAALWWQALAAQGLPANAINVIAKLNSNADRARIVSYQPILHGNGMAKAP
jgi:subtilisin family serine protease